MLDHLDLGRLDEEDLGDATELVVARLEHRASRQLTDDSPRAGGGVEDIHLDAWLLDRVVVVFGTRDFHTLVSTEANQSEVGVELVDRVRSRKHEVAEADDVVVRAVELSDQFDAGVSGRQIVQGRRHLANGRPIIIGMLQRHHSRELTEVVDLVAVRLEVVVGVCAERAVNKIALQELDDGRLLLAPEVEDFLYVIEVERMSSSDVLTETGYEHVAVVAGSAFEVRRLLLVVESIVSRPGVIDLLVALSTVPELDR